MTIAKDPELRGFRKDLEIGEISMDQRRKEDIMKNSCHRRTRVPSRTVTKARHHGQFQN